MRCYLRLFPESVREEIFRCADGAVSLSKSRILEFVRKYEVSLVFEKVCFLNPVRINGVRVYHVQSCRYSRAARERARLTFSRMMDEDHIGLSIYSNFTDGPAPLARSGFTALHCGMFVGWLKWFMFLLVCSVLAPFVYGGPFAIFLLTWGSAILISCYVCNAVFVGCRHHTITASSRVVLGAKITANKTEERRLSYAVECKHRSYLLYSQIPSRKYDALLFHTPMFCEYMLEKVRTDPKLLTDMQKLLTVDQSRITPQNSEDDESIGERGPTILDVIRDAQGEFFAPTMITERKTVGVSKLLCEHELQHLKRVAQSVGVDTAVKESSSEHPYASAIRDIFIEKVIRYVPNGTFTLVVGGEASAFPKAGYHHIFVWKDEKDTRRYESNVRFCLQHNIPFYTSPLECIGVEYDVLLVCNAAFDIGLTNILVIGRYINCREVFIVNPYSVKMVYQDEGLLVGLGQRFCRVNENGRDIIKFYHVSETDSIYEHEANFVHQLHLVRSLQLAEGVYANGTQLVHHSDMIIMKFSYNTVAGVKEFNIVDDFADSIYVARLLPDVESFRTAAQTILVPKEAVEVFMRNIKSSNLTTADFKGRMHRVLDEMPAGKLPPNFSGFMNDAGIDDLMITLTQYAASVQYLEKSITEFEESLCDACDCNPVYGKRKMAKLRKSTLIWSPPSSVRVIPPLYVANIETDLLRANEYLFNEESLPDWFFRLLWGYIVNFATITSVSIWREVVHFAFRYIEIARLRASTAAQRLTNSTYQNVAMMPIIDPPIPLKKESYVGIQLLNAAAQVKTDAPTLITAADIASIQSIRRPNGIFCKPLGKNWTKSLYVEANGVKTDTQQRADNMGSLLSSKNYVIIVRTMKFVFAPETTVREPTYVEIDEEGAFFLWVDERSKMEEVVTTKRTVRLTNAHSLLRYGRYIKDSYDRPGCFHYALNAMFDKPLPQTLASASSQFVQQNFTDRQQFMIISGRNAFGYQVTDAKYVILVIEGHCYSLHSLPRKLPLVQPVGAWVEYLNGDVLDDTPDQVVAQPASLTQREKARMRVIPVDRWSELRNNVPHVPTVAEVEDEGSNRFMSKIRSRCCSNVYHCVAERVRRYCKYSFKTAFILLIVLMTINAFNCYLRTSIATSERQFASTVPIAVELQSQRTAKAMLSAEVQDPPKSEHSEASSVSNEPKWVKVCREDPELCATVMPFAAKISGTIEGVIGVNVSTITRELGSIFSDGLKLLVGSYERAEFAQFARLKSRLAPVDIDRLVGSASLNYAAGRPLRNIEPSALQNFLSDFAPWQIPIRLWHSSNVRLDVSFINRHLRGVDYFENTVYETLGLTVETMYIPTSGGCVMKAAHFLFLTGDGWNDISDVGYAGVAGPKLIEVILNAYGGVLLDVEAKIIYSNTRTANKVLRNVFVYSGGHVGAVYSITKPNWPVRSFKSFKKVAAGFPSSLPVLRTQRSQLLSMSLQSHYGNAVREYLVHQLTAVICIFQRVAEVVGVLTPRARAARVAPDMNEYDLHNIEDLKSLKASGISVVTDGFVFLEVKIRDNYAIVDTSNRWVFGSQHISYVYENDVAQYCTQEFLHAIDDYEFFATHVILMDGVPGCGKTRHIADTAVAGVDLVLTNTRSTLPHLDPDRRYTSTVRTYGSFLKSPDVEADVCHFDEALMVHPGNIYICIYFSKPRRVYCYGDTLQLKFQGHVAAAPLTFLDLRYTRVQYNNKTYRCPMSIVQVLTPFYPNIVTESLERGTYKIKKILPGDYSALPTKSQFVTFTTHEKQLLVNAGFHARTIAECQGITLNFISIVRLMIQEMAIYNTQSVLIVGLTRHTTHIDYYTVDDKDILSKLLMGAGPSIPFSETRRSYDIVHTGTVSVDCGRHQQFEQLLPTDEPQSQYYAALKSSSLYDHCAVETVESTKSWADMKLIDSAPPLVSLCQMQSAVDSMYDRLDMQLLEYRLDPINLIIPQQLHVNREALIFSKDKATEFLKPKLATPQVPRNNSKPAYYVFALLKRNLDPPVLHKLRETSLVTDIVDTFMTTYIDQQKFKSCNNRSIYYNELWLRHWYADRSGDQRKMFEGLANDLTRADRYEVHVKPDLKVPLDNSHNATVIGGQVIAAHHCLETGKFSPVFQAFMNQLMTCLKPQFAINAKLSVVEISNFMTVTLKGSSSMRVLETDFSKFDKSQDGLSLEVFLEILKRFRLPKSLIDEWRESHVITTLFDRHFGLNQPVAFQRKSGDASTFCGNTIITMAALAFAYPVVNSIGGMFGGDDSVVFFKKAFNIEDRSQYIMDIFNLFTKIEVFERSIYFASKFLVNVHGAWWMVPDPVKNAVRLGRHDIFCFEHLTEYARGFSDNMQFLKDADIRHAVAVAAADRYAKKVKSTAEIETIVNFIACIMYGTPTLYQLYEGSDVLWNRPLPYRYL